MILRDMFVFLLVLVGGPVMAQSMQCPSVCEQATRCDTKSQVHLCYHNCDATTGHACIEHYAAHIVEIPKLLNTSNEGKLKEFQRLFKQHHHALSNTSFDLDEIDATALEVIIQKASAVNNKKGGVIVEDTSLDIEGEDVGVNIRWLLDNLDNFSGKKAVWTVMLAFREGDLVFVTSGQVRGTIVKPEGEGGFGFDPFFLPDGAEQTLALAKPDHVNARAMAVEHMIQRKFIAVKEAIDQWDGKWQSHE